MFPFVILNLSDLHINSNGKCSDEEFILKNFVHDYSEYTQNDCLWHLDFIVIPGDIVEKATDENYRKAASILKYIAKKLKVPCKNIIVTPGNHDKFIPDCKSMSESDPELKQFAEEYQILIKNYDSLGKICKKTDPEEFSKSMSKFVNIHSEAFSSFINFHKKMRLGKNITYSEFKSNDLKYLVGLKVFEEKKVCFLLLNTEWKHTARKIKNKTVSEYEEINQNDCELDVGNFIVAELCEVIKKKYLDFTIITLMHRNPGDFPWKFSNHTDMAQQDSLGCIEEITDILITGHSHAIKTQIPDMLKNNIQHFQLGSPSCGTKKISEHFPHSISAISVDPLFKTIELLQGHYPMPSVKGSKWKFCSTQDKYKLRKIYYEKSLHDITSQKADELHRIRVRHFDEQEIKKQIKESFYSDTTILKKIPPLIIKEIFSTKKNDFNITEIIAGNNIVQHLILYYVNQGKNNDKILPSVLEKYHEITEELRESVLLMKLVVNFVVIDINYKDKFHKKNLY